MADKTLIPSEPGADWLDEGVSRLRAMKTTVGLVIARALEAAHLRFLVLGSAIAVVDARTVELEKRDIISWPVLDDRLTEIELAAARMAHGQMDWAGHFDERLRLAETTLANAGPTLRRVPELSSELSMVLGCKEGGADTLNERVTKLESTVEEALAQLTIDRQIRRGSDPAGDWETLRLLEERQKRLADRHAQMVQRIVAVERAAKEHRETVSAALYALRRRRRR